MFTVSFEHHSKPLKRGNSVAILLMRKLSLGGNQLAQIPSKKLRELLQLSIIITGSNG